MRIEQLQTPALIVERKTLLRNMAAMEALLAGSSLALRPHYKSHKCAALARMQIENGAKGMTCAKLSEARDLVDAGIEDVLIANQIVEPEKLDVLARLAGKCRLTVCVDDRENVLALARAAEHAGTTVGCLVEFEIGMMRCGVASPEAVLELARLIDSLDSLEFAGIQAYAGHVSHMVDLREREDYTRRNREKLTELLELLARNGLLARILSGGSTGTAAIKAADGLYNELQAGSYLFMDATYRDLALPFENSLFVLTTVVSRSGDLTVVDAGVKTCGVDQGMPAVRDAQVREIVASEEHFQLHGLSVEKKPGDKLLLVPGHCCSTVNLHDRIYVVEDGKVVDRWFITGRGYGK